MPGRKVARKTVGEGAAETVQNGTLSGRGGVAKPGLWFCRGTLSETSGGDDPAPPALPQVNRNRRFWFTCEKCPVLGPPPL